MADDGEAANHELVLVESRRQTPVAEPEPSGWWIEPV